MSTITVKATTQLVEQLLKTGTNINKCIITKGLPDDAKLVSVSMDYNIIYLVFSTKIGEETENKEINIEIKEEL